MPNSCLLLLDVMDMFTLQATRASPHQHLLSRAGPYTARLDEFILWAKVGRAMLKLRLKSSENRL